DDEGKFSDFKRLIHTLKGESALMGLSDVEKLCHKIEDLLNKVNPGQIVDILLEVKDWLRSTFDAYSGKKPPLLTIEQILEKLVVPDEKSVIKEFKKRTENLEQIEPEIADEEVQEKSSIEGDIDLLTDFVSESNDHLETADQQMLVLETEPKNEDALNSVFRAFHTIKGVAGFLGLKDIGLLAHDAENLLDRVRKGELVLDSDVIDITFEVLDKMKNMISDLGSAIAKGSLPTQDGSLPELIKRINDLVSGNHSNEDVGVSGNLSEKSQEPVKNITESNISGIEVNKITARKQPTSTSLQKSVSSNATVKLKETLKVDAERLDLLVDTIGELVISESMISQSEEIRSIGSANLFKQIARLDKITRDLQDMGTSLRMIPIRATFQKIARLVRDLSKKANKPIEFVMTGEDTELDKTVVDKIGDPLVHMMRNCVDHGIEASPVERREAGKPEIGKINLRAFHSGGNIYIEVEDDGRGLDRDAILAKARERGIIKNGEILTDNEVWNLIFEAGFSTAKEVTEVSGRGVGMDVVRRNIESLRGRVEIRSEKGKGSIFTIILPLTLAIIDGMVIGVGVERYIIPTLSVITSLRPQAEDLSTVLNRGEMLSFQGELIPMFRLSNFFNIEGTENNPTQGIVIVVESDGHRVGLLADTLLGQQQIVIKSLSESVHGILGISGGTIMSDGRVGLILDVDGLVKISKEGSR
ncbi:MAG: chemotaxis protein CheA, partial [Candidatus Neomarinimicrobiota bacterium]